MTERRSFERLLAERMETERGSPPFPESFYDGFRQRAGVVRQRPRWLALIKEKPMRYESRIAVGSPTVRLTAVMAAAILLAVAVVSGGIAGSRLLAADGVIVVDPSGNGTVTTISEAVAMAKDGDEILVKPGTYQEPVVIDKDITLRGEERDSVIIEATDDAPIYDDFWWGSSSYSILLLDSTAAVSGITVVAPTDEGPDDPDPGNVVVRGGAPRIDDIALRGPSLYVHAGSAATIRDSDLTGGWVFIEERSPATIEGSRFAAVVANSTNTRTSGGPSTIRNNRTEGILIYGPALVEGNEVVAPEEPLWPDKQYGSAIDVQGGEGWVIRGNRVTGFLEDSAIEASRASEGRIVDNVVVDSRTGIHLGRGGQVVEGNEISGGDVGIVTGLDSSSWIAGNSVTGASGRGLALLGSPTLRDNRSCDNSENLWVGDGATPDIDESNEICPDTQ